MNSAFSTRSFLRLAAAVLVVAVMAGLASAPLRAATHPELLIVADTALPGTYDGVLAALREEYPDAEELTFSGNVSSAAAEIAEVMPQRMIVVVEASKVTPDFVDDLDTAMMGLDEDGYIDVVWSVVTGFSSRSAEDLVTAPDSPGGSTMIVANPDGSLYPQAGYVGAYVSDFLSGAGMTYVNLSTEPSEVAVADVISQDINDGPKNGFFYDGHGYPDGWYIQEADYFSGEDADLHIVGPTASYDIQNNTNALVYSSACLTSRIQGSRSGAWEPWESEMWGSNVAGVLSDNIGLAFMDDSPGVYIAPNSVHYMDTLTKHLYHHVAEGYSAAEALSISKNVSYLIAQGEIRDTNSGDGTGADFLTYLTRTTYTIGDVGWKAADQGTPPYTVDCTTGEQQDQYADNDRGMVYVDEPVRFSGGVVLSFNRTLSCDTANDSADRQGMTEYLIDEVGSFLGLGVYCDGETFAIGGKMRTTEDTVLMEFAGDDPSSVEKFYDYPSTPVFKCAPGSDGLIWVVAGGATDNDSDSFLEFTISAGYSQSFDVYYYMPPVNQAVEDIEGGGGKDVTLTYRGSVMVRDIIAKVPVPGATTEVSVTGGDATDVTLVTVSEEEAYCEFSVATMSTDQVAEFTVTYDAEDEPDPEPEPEPEPEPDPEPPVPPPAPLSPIADAGEDIYAHVGETVTLDGSASFGANLEYSWEQTSGPVAALSSTTAVRPSFVAPFASQDYLMVFRLTVTEPGKGSDSESVSVFVYSDNTPPEVTVVMVEGMLGTVETAEVHVKFYLQDAENDLCEVTLQYTGGNAQDEWEQAAVTGQISDVKSNQWHMISWESTKNEPNPGNSEFRVRVIPHDGIVEGSSVSTEVFTLGPAGPGGLLSPTATGGGGGGGGGCFVGAAAR
jgi:hypothetical protein